MKTLTLDTPALARQYEDLSDKQYEHGKLLIQALDLGPGWRVLDVGCGTGRLTEYVASLVGKAGHVVGIDPLQTRIAIARIRAAGNLSFQIGRAERLDGFFDNSFDAVYLNSVFHWLPEKRQSLAETCRVLKSGGRLGISTASKERPHELDRIVRTVLRRPPYAPYLDTSETPPYKVTSEELSALLEQAGFRVITIEIRSFTDYFDSPGTVIHFSNASSFGHFLSGLPLFLRTAAIREIEFELEKYRRPEGIVLTRNLIFAVAEKK